MFLGVLPFTFLLLLNFKILTSFRRLKSRINNNKKKVSHANSTGRYISAKFMTITDFLLDEINISGADRLSPPCLLSHNPNQKQKKTVSAIYKCFTASTSPGVLRQQSRDVNMSLVLISTVAVFLLCHTPRCIGILCIITSHHQVSISIEVSPLFSHCFCIAFDILLSNLNGQTDPDRLFSVSVVLRVRCQFFSPCLCSMGRIQMQNVCHCHVS